MRLQKPYCMTRVESMVHYQRGPHRRASHHRGGHAVGMKERQHSQHRFLAKASTDPLALLPGVGHHVGVAQSDRFGRARGATGRQNVGGIGDGADGYRPPTRFRLRDLFPKPS